MGRCEKRRKVWRGRGRSVYRFAAGDGERRRDVECKWLKCLLLLWRGILSRWGADGPYKNMGGCVTGVHLA